jgi:hypothetical protein
MLEDRMVPSTVGVDVNKLLTVTGTPYSDTITIDYQYSRVVVQHDGVTETFDPSKVSDIYINSLGGNDTITVERLRWFTAVLGYLHLLTIDAVT